MKGRITLRFIICMIIGDVLAILAAYSFAYIIRMKLSSDPVKVFVSAKAFFQSLLLLLPFNIAIFSMLGLYRHQSSFAQMIGRLLMGAFAAMLFMISVDYFHASTIFPAKKVPLYGLLISILLLALERSVLYLIRYLRHRFSKVLPRVIVIGDNTIAHTLVNDIREPGSGYALQGVVGDRRLKWVTHKTLNDAVDNLPPDMIIQVTTKSEPKVNPDYLNYAQRHYAEFKFVPSDINDISDRLEMELFMDDVPVMAVKPTRLVGWGRIWKRLFDIVCSLLGLIVLSPIFLVVYIAEKIVDPEGSALFHQTRLTRGDHRFQLYKFRTQYSKYDGTTPEQAFAMMGKPQLAKKYRRNGDFLEDDPRVTKIGHVLRKYSLDELPQLFNVLRGDISLVGPRALIPEELDSYEQKHKILNVKSGITGLAQISGRRDLPWDQRRKLDVYYVQHWSFGLDIKILFQTFLQVIAGKGAK